MVYDGQGLCLMLSVSLSQCRRGKPQFKLKVVSVAKIKNQTHLIYTHWQSLPRCAFPKANGVGSLQFYRHPSFIVFATINQKIWTKYPAVSILFSNCSTKSWLRYTALIFIVRQCWQLSFLLSWPSDALCVGLFEGKTLSQYCR